jgi:hypothetical protein
MPENLKRVTGRGDLHLIALSCYQRRALLLNAAERFFSQARHKIAHSSL